MGFALYLVHQQACSGAAVHCWDFQHAASFTLTITLMEPNALHCGTAQEEEFYVITWDAKKETIFEMPTGGAALMRSGKNLLKLARKEQCLALLCASLPLHPIDTWRFALIGSYLCCPDACAGRATDL